MIIDDDVYNATEKFRESYKIHGITEFEVSAFSIGYLQAKNKAKETLYTKEQLMEAIELARLIDYNGSNDYYMSEDEIIKALKP